jgi:hypothetical protein
MIVRRHLALSLIRPRKIKAETVSIWKETMLAVRWRLGNRISEVTRDGRRKILKAGWTAAWRETEERMEA